MKFAPQALWVMLFVSVISANADVLIASFDLGDDEVYSGYGPYAGQSAIFTPVTTASGAIATDNGITLQTYNATQFFTGTDSTDPLNPNALFGDYAVQAGPSEGGDDQGNFTITGLNPAQQYNIYIIAPNGTGWAIDNVYGGDYTVTTGTADSTTVTATGGISGVFTNWVEGRDYAVFTSATANESGEFSGTFNRISGQAHTGMAGVQIVAIPEPASLALCGIFGVGALVVRRLV